MKNTKRIVTYAIFTGLVIVLQLMATYINFGSFPITLTLIPIIIAGAILGVGAGAFMGTVFGVVVALMVVTGADPSGAVMFAAHPIITVLTCILKGSAAGFVGALAYKLLKDKNQTLACVVSAAITPIVNTSLLALSIILFFGGEMVIFISLMVSVNFLIELLINILLAPGLLRIINSSRFIH